MYDHNIHKNNSPSVFKETCKKIENAFPEAKKHNLLIDVDGTTIQTYSKDNKEIDVYDDYEVGAVFVKSEFDLSTILK